MTAPARITQADMDRATKSLSNAGIERAKIVMDLANGRIEIIIDDTIAVRQASDRNPWDDELTQ